jgi:monothiol glutaredoxin
MSIDNPSSTEAVIKKQLAENPVILYMKGSPEAPECGFSGAAVAALKQTGKPFAYVNILQAPFIRERLPKISNWPTFPQLFIKGELVGGSDIVVAMVADGSLMAMLEEAEAV